MARVSQEEKGGENGSFLGVTMMSKLPYERGRPLVQRGEEEVFQVTEARKDADREARDKVEAEIQGPQTLEGVESVRSDHGDPIVVEPQYLGLSHCGVNDASEGRSKMPESSRAVVHGLRGEEGELVVRQVELLDVGERREAVDGSVLGHTAVGKPG